LNPEEFFRKAGLKPRPLQLEAAKQLAEMVLSNPVMGFQAPTGFGKTITVLAAISLADAFPVTWRVRTHEIAKRIAEDCALLNFPFYIAAGREKLCPLKEEYKSNTYYFCRFLKFKCTFFKGLSSIKPENIFSVDYDQLLRKLKGTEICPYYAQLYQQAHVYIIPYSLGLSFDVNLEVIDEAHNMVLDVYSIPEAKLREALAELDIHYEPTGDLIQQAFIETAQMKIVELLEQGKMPLIAGRVIAMLARGTFVWREEGEIHILKFIRPRKRTIFVSATLEPLQKIYNIPVLEIPVQRKPEALIATWMTTRFHEWDYKMAKEYNDLIFLLRKHFQRIVVFATKRVARSLRADYVEEAPKDWKGVFLLFSRGKKGEGVNIESEVVVVAGAPYLPPFIHVEKLGLTHDDVATITTIQNIGRTLRHPENNPLIILADDRFRKLKPILDRYYTNIETDDLHSLDKAIQKYKASHPI
jgi:DNA excision repair protein ERCC-2